MTSDVTVIGARNVGGTLARSWARAGRQVTVGVRNPQAPEVAALVEAGEGRIVAADSATAVAAAPVIVCAIPGASMRDFFAEHAAALAGRTVVDTTNDLSGGPTSGRLSSLPALAELVPSAAGYRAFNSIGAENMGDPVLGGERASLFYAGPDTDARAAVHDLIAATGLEPVYVGDGADAHLAVDTLTTLWFALAFGQGLGRRIAFRLVRD